MMQIKRATPINEFLAKLLLLIVPVLAVAYFVIWVFNQNFVILSNQALQQWAYLSAATLASAVFYSFRFRFIPTFAILFIGLYFIYKGIDSLAFGEFDAFFLSVNFWIFSFCFIAGWLLGWCLIRLKYGAIILSALILVAGVFLIAKRNEFFFTDSAQAVNQFVRWIAPLGIFMVYLIYTNLLIQNYKNKEQAFWWYIVRRSGVFLVLAVLIMGGVIYWNKDAIQTTLEQAGGGGEAGNNSMLKKNKDNTLELEDYMRLRGNLGRNNEPMFAAYIDNFFPNEDIPNPLYLTAFYYSKFDDSTETFEPDENLPFNDLFRPDPSKIPLYFTHQDSSVLQYYALQEKNRKVVEIEVYKQQLSPKEFVAPATAFFIQPIAIEKEFRGEFKSAYRAKSYVSDLNSAFFIYNSDDPQIRNFQEMRFEKLRAVKHYDKVDADFLKYFTYMPSGNKYERIKQLADSITRNAVTPIDKVLAIRDYFLAKDENGEAIYSYTDNPGIPDIPSASKLLYFLFENKKGYCAYYAGATLFMLHAIGIPSRITVGFLTVDRSTGKNKGWYWYYADQAHAWVQVYFPGYGWLDFDTTVGNDDAQESPQADGTPPLQPSKAYLAADGVLQEIDTVNKKAVLQVSKMVYHDKTYQLDSSANLSMDLSVATILRDSVDVPLALLQKGDSATAVSFAEAFKNKKPTSNQAEVVFKQLIKPAPIDELYVKVHSADAPKDQKESIFQTPDIKYSWYLIGVGILLIVGLIIFWLLGPIVLLVYILRRKMAKSEGQKSYWTYRFIMFYLNQLGYPLKDTYASYAMVLNQKMQLEISDFFAAYFEIKYGTSVNKKEHFATVVNYYNRFLKEIKTAVSTKERVKAFLKPQRALQFLRK